MRKEFNHNGKGNVSELKTGDVIPIYSDAVKLLQQMADVTSHHVRREYRYTICDEMIRTCMRLIYEIDMMNMSRDKRAGAERVAALARTLQSGCYALYQLRALSDGPIATMAPFISSIIAQAVGIWKDAVRTQGMR